jgi:PPOX class probable F420-dependent enzyme
MSITVPDAFQDLLSIPVVTLTTLGSDGAPQTSAVWFLRDDDGKIRISLNTSRQKTRNMQNDPRVTLLFMDPTNPYRTLELRGSVEIAPDPDYAFAAKLGAKYNADVRTFDPPGVSRVTVTFTPVKVNTYGS